MGIAINPNTIIERPFNESTFKIGIIPYGKRTQIEADAFFNKDGKTKEEIYSMLNQSYDLVQWGIRGHSGFSFEDGTPVPFKTQKAKSGNFEYDVVSDETMAVYAASGILTDLAGLVNEFNYQKKEIAKN